MRSNVLLPTFVLLFILLAQGMVFSNPIDVRQGEQVTLTLKLVNVGDIALRNVKAEFIDTPSWIMPEGETASVNLAVKSPEQERPTALLPFSFKVGKEAPVGKSNPLTLKIISASSDYWTKEILLSVLPRPLPESFAVFQNFPNPFNPETWIPYQIHEASKVTIRIYDASGRLVKTLSLGYKEPDFYVTKGSAAYWDGRNDFGERVSNGVYFYHLSVHGVNRPFQAGRKSAIRKMLIVK